MGKLSHHQSGDAMCRGGGSLEHLQYYYTIEMQTMVVHDGKPAATTRRVLLSIHWIECEATFRTLTGQSTKRPLLLKTLALSPRPVSPHSEAPDASTSRN